jgi:phosphoglycerate dehydrogenase-like enzyme
MDIDIAVLGGYTAGIRAGQLGVLVACIDQLCLLGRAQPACEWEWPLSVSVPDRRNRRRLAQIPPIRRRRPGLNAVPVAEHAVALLLALARRLPEASKGFEPGRWGEPADRSLAGTAACILGAGAIGSQVARRLTAFDVTVAGVRRHPPDGPVPPFAAVYPADGPLVTHPRIVATAHTASLTSDYFAAASRRLGDALAAYLDHQPPAGLRR